MVHEITNFFRFIGVSLATMAFVVALYFQAIARQRCPKKYYIPFYLLGVLLVTLQGHLPINESSVLDVIILMFYAIIGALIIEYADVVYHKLEGKPPHIEIAEVLKLK